MIQYYKILGVPSTATIKQVKKAFRKKAFLVHPDYNKTNNAKDEYIRLQKAYDYITGVLTGEITTFQRPDPPRKYRPSESAIKRKKGKDRIVRDYSNQRRALDSQENGAYVISTLIGFFVGVFVALVLLDIVTIIFCPGIGILITCKYTYNIYKKKRSDAYKKYKERIRKI